jgi:hypothetical protein
MDGSQLKAVNSTHKHLTKTKLEKALKDIDETIAQYWRDRATADREASSVHPSTSEKLPEQIKRLQERQTRDREVGPEITASGETQLARTDPDRRSRPKSPTVAVGDNVPMAVDSQQKLMVEQEVTKASTDDEQLSPLAIRAQETLGVERMRAVADMGDDPGHAIKSCDEAGVEADVPKPSTSANTQLGRFGTERCTDDPEKDGYQGPQGEALIFRCETTARGRHSRDYATRACRRGPLKEQCTSNNAGRRMTRGVDEHVLERMAERRNANPEIMQERTPLVEHPVGTIKHTNDQGDGLRKGLKNVRAEFSLACLADNLKRVITILGVPPLLRALG